MDVTVSIVTYNSADCIAACLDSVLAQTGVALEVTVVDNASSDQTLERLKPYEGRVGVIANRENVGFGRAHNQALRSALGKYYYLLNPDAQIGRPDALQRLCTAMAAHPQWGLAGTAVLTPGGENEALPELTYPGESHARNDFSGLPGQIAWIIGASLFFRSEVFAQLGGFDPEFFLYSEETDICLRLRQLGSEIGYVDEVSVRHIGGASEAGRDPYDVWTRRMQGMHVFWKKHFAPEDVQGLVRRDLRRARYRAFLNGLLARMQPPRSAAWLKQRRYEAIADTSAGFLAESAGLPGRQADAPPITPHGR